MVFSIITISFNQVGYLKECIDSIISQDAKVEYIVVDGGSTDGSIELLSSYRLPNLRWQTGPDGGPADALNKGLALATGDFVGFINSDDYLLPGALKTMEAIIATHPGHDVYYGPGYILNELDKTNTWVMPTKWHIGVYRAGLTVMMQQSLFIRLSTVRERGITFNLANTTHWDGEFVVDLDLAGASFFRHHSALSVFRIHDQSISGGAQGSLGRERYLRQLQIVNDRIDLSGRVKVKSKAFWLMWLFYFDFRVMVGRSFRRLYSMGKSVFPDRANRT